MKLLFAATRPHGVAVLLLLTTLLLLVSRAEAEVTGDLSLLTKVADLQKKNLDAIEQWTGRAELKFRKRAPEGYDLTYSVDARFWHDAVARASCFSWLITESSTRFDARENLVNSLQGHRAGELQLGEDYYIMPLSAVKPDYVPVVQLVPRREPTFGSVSQMFYPMSYFRLWNSKSEEFFAKMLKYSGEEWMHIHIRQEGQQVLLDTGGARYPEFRKQYVFDLSQNGLLVKFEGRDPKRGESQRQTYREFSGVYLPVHTVYRNARHDGTDVSEKEVHWKDQTLNEPIPEESFTLEAMGVPAGAQVVDIQTRQTYRYAPA
ncbi:hypothetical protein Mal4_07850 [Maioricimonas rarisocia]|uniref:Outer membrane lipoprotein-sorting protein n=1 Tax=Maioricimonas rarisocia TaxID=2528026 RepID=A0A517Z236_9PLAN|nr:hypothetical protein [Maioricimonas rarisocia]QDU36499.1 hypothetical protein Mal4_07850 [Maioricimonas rarisocia]